MGVAKMAEVSIPDALAYDGVAQLAAVDAAVGLMAAAGWCSVGASRRPIVEAHTFESAKVVDGVECPVVLLSLLRMDTATLGAHAGIVEAFRDAGWVVERVDAESFHLHGPGLVRWLERSLAGVDRLRAEALRLITVFAVGEVLPDGRLAFSVPEARKIEAKMDWSA